MVAVHVRVHAVHPVLQQLHDFLPPLRGRLRVPLLRHRGLRALQVHGLLSGAAAAHRITLGETAHAISNLSNQKKVQKSVPPPLSHDRSARTPGHVAP